MLVPNRINYSSRRPKCNLVHRQVRQALLGGCELYVEGVMLGTEQDKLDHCPDCSLPLEIAAVSLSLFRKAAMLFVCPNCGLTRTDGCGARIPIRDRIDALDRKLAIAASRLLPLSKPLAVRRALDRTLGGREATPPIRH
jgi:hypothetical protein